GGQGARAASWQRGFQPGLPGGIRQALPSPRARTSSPRPWRTSYGALQVLDRSVRRRLSATMGEDLAGWLDCSDPAVEGGEAAEDAAEGADAEGRPTRLLTATARLSKLDCRSKLWPEEADICSLEMQDLVSDATEMLSEMEGAEAEIRLLRNLCDMLSQQKQQQKKKKKKDEKSGAVSRSAAADSQEQRVRRPERRGVYTRRRHRRRRQIPLHEHLLSGTLFHIATCASTFSANRVFTDGIASTLDLRQRYSVAIDPRDIINDHWNPDDRSTATPMPRLLLQSQYLQGNTNNAKYSFCYSGDETAEDFRLAKSHSCCSMPNRSAEPHDAPDAAAAAIAPAIADDVHQPAVEEALPVQLLEQLLPQRLVGQLRGDQAERPLRHQPTRRPALFGVSVAAAVIASVAARSSDASRILRVSKISLLKSPAAGCSRIGDLQSCRAMRERLQLQFRQKASLMQSLNDGKTWTRRFESYVVAAGIKDESQAQEILLYSAGEYIPTLVEDNNIARGDTAKDLAKNIQDHLDKRTPSSSCDIC
uniref:START domain-containing protein n=1 Tax=Macrostomum lignano TaxID=282301 RepID=A0A1I8FGS7_9PLAT